MCVPCVLQVSRAFTFKQVCQRSDQTLRLYLQGIENSLAETSRRDDVDVKDAFSVQNANDDHRTALYDDETNKTIATDKSVDAMKSESGPTTSSVLHNNLQQTQSFNVQYSPDTELDNNNLDKCLMMVSSELAQHIKLDGSDADALDANNLTFPTANALLDNPIIDSVDSVKLENMTTSTQMNETNDNDLTTVPLDSDEIPADLLSENYGKVL